MRELYYMLRPTRRPSRSDAEANIPTRTHRQPNNIEHQFSPVWRDSLLLSSPESTYKNSSGCDGTQHIGVHERGEKGDKGSGRGDICILTQHTHNTHTFSYVMFMIWLSSQAGKICGEKFQRTHAKYAPIFVCVFPACCFLHCCRHRRHRHPHPNRPAQNIRTHTRKAAAKSFHPLHASHYPGETATTAAREACEGGSKVDGSRRLISSLCTERANNNWWKNRTNTDILALVRFGLVRAIAVSRWVWEDCLSLGWIWWRADVEVVWSVAVNGVRMEGWNSVQRVQLDDVKIIYCMFKIYKNILIIRRI